MSSIQSNQPRIYLIERNQHLSAAKELIVTLSLVESLESINSKLATELAVPLSKLEPVAELYIHTESEHKLVTANNFQQLFNDLPKPVIFSCGMSLF